MQLQSAGNLILLKKHLSDCFDLVDLNAYVEAGVVAVYARGRYTSFRRRSRNQSLGFNELLQTGQGTHGRLYYDLYFFSL